MLLTILNFGLYSDLTQAEVHLSVNVTQQMSMIASFVIQLTTCVLTTQYTVHLSIHLT